MRKTNYIYKNNTHAVTGLIIGFYLHELVFILLLWFCFIFVFVFVIDDHDTQSDEAHIMCLKISNVNKSSAFYLVYISVKVRSVIYNR